MEETSNQFDASHNESLLQTSKERTLKERSVDSMKEMSPRSGTHTHEPATGVHMSQSPHVSDDVICLEQQRDEASFGLCNSSFDTFSDAGGAFGVDETMLNSEDGGVRLNADSAPFVFSPSVPPREGDADGGPFDIALPELKNDHSSELSIGDLSPIKVSYSKGRTPRIERRSSNAPDGLPETSSVFPYDWRSETSHHLYSTRSNPFFVLRSARNAFGNVKYLFPCLQASFVGSGAIHLSELGGIRQYRDRKGDGESQRDLIVATRRVESAVCAFGGTLQSRGSPPHERLNDCSKCSDYMDQLNERYTINHAKLSWDIEESPPIDFHRDHENSAVSKSIQDLVDLEIRKGDNPSGGSRADSSSHSEGTMNDPTKVKYRCKLCGQWKQNHHCRYQQPLQRSIGVMVYPAVNSYTAAEPGIIAPPLTRMNNFVSYDSDPGDDSPHSDHATLRRPKVNDGDPFAIHTSTVTPESLRGATHFHSPQSSLSAQSSDDPMSRHVANAGTGVRPRRYLKRSHNDLTMDSTTSIRRGGYDSMHSVVPFVASVTLRPEHYRAVTPLTKDSLIVSPDTRATGCSDSVEQGTRSTFSCKAPYEYPPIPLTFQERKRMSDTLFYLAQEIPSLTMDCAALLQLARTRGEWDIAVAELLTQVVVALYCGEGDSRLDGLQQYLLTIGISC